jgi:hypothetical protein
MATYKEGNRVKCPHCITVVLLEGLGIRQQQFNFPNLKYKFILSYALCPNCLQPIITIEKGTFPQIGFIPEVEFVIWPLSTSRPPVPSEVPEIIANDYKEACLVLGLSSKASAALSRRCLQNLLRDATKVDKHDLIDQIKDVLPKLPSQIANNLDGIRVIGNFAAHPLKEKSSGEIIDVEPGEAEWNLDVLEQLFDFYYVQPNQAKIRRDAINEKLKAAGKSPLLG